MIKLNKKEQLIIELLGNEDNTEQYFNLVEVSSRDVVIKKRVESNKISKKTGETLLKWVVA